MFRQPFHIMNFGGRGRPIPDTAIIKIGQCGLSLDVAMMVEHIPQPYLARLAADPPAEETIEPVVNAVPRDLNPVEPVHLGQPGGFLNASHLSPDDWKALSKPEAVGFSEPGIGPEIGDTLPAVDDPELGPLSGEDRGQRRSLAGAASGAVFMRIMKAEFVLVFLNRLERRQFNIGLTGKTARIKAPGIVTRLTMNDLLGQQPAMAAALTQTSPQANNAKGVALAGDRPDQRRAIDCVGDRAIDHGMDTGLHEGRHPGKRALHGIGHAIKIIGA